MTGATRAPTTTRITRTPLQARAALPPVLSACQGRSPSATPTTPRGQAKAKPSGASAGKASTTAAARAAVEAYNKQYRGIKSSDPAPLHGESTNVAVARAVPLSLPALHAALLQMGTTASVPSWKSAIPSRAKLHGGPFGKPRTDHNWTVEGSFSTCMVPLLTSGMLPFVEFASLCSITPLIPHLGRMAVALRDYDFTWLKAEDPCWRSQATVPQNHAKATLAALLHFNMHAPDVMRYLGGTYTGEHRNVDATVAILVKHDVDPWLIAQYVRAMSIGSPNHFMATTTRENAELHRTMGNHSSMTTFLTETINTAVKEHRNRFNMPLGCYMSRYVPHCFITPQHALSKPGKTLRLIFDAAKRYNAHSTPLNMMTSTHRGTELRCLYGDAFVTFLERIWDLRITYPLLDVAMHANDIKSCFRQMKLHPDIMPAFSIVIANYLFLQTALPFGMDFSPQNWEPVRRLVEVLSQKLYKDQGLRAKHRKYLDLLRWDSALGHLRETPVVAKT
jgi:hypothetical protein